MEVLWMKTKNRIAITLFTVLGLCVFAMTGCQGQQDATPQGQQPGLEQQGGQQLGAPGMQAPDMGGQEGTDFLNNNPDMNQPGLQMGNANNEQRAANITNQVDKMNEVNEVNTVCSGDNAVIAYSPSNTAGNTDAVKNMIINKVKQADPSIKNVAVNFRLRSYY